MALKPKTLRPGEHQNQKFIPAGSRQQYVQYDYRDLDGELFSCVKQTLAECITAKEEWLKQKAKSLQ